MTGVTLPKKRTFLHPPRKEILTDYCMLIRHVTCLILPTGQYREQSPGCPTKLEFDFQKEQQKGVCWKETLRCELCGFCSDRTKLYEELTTQSRGAKTAKPNIGLWVALMDNPIMGTTLQEIFPALNTPAPSYSGLQYTANKVGPMLVQTVREDLRH